MNTILLAALLISSVSCSLLRATPLATDDFTYDFYVCGTYEGACSATKGEKQHAVFYGARKLMFTKYMKTVEVFGGNDCSASSLYSYRYNADVTSRDNDEGTVTVKGKTTSLEIAMVDSTIDNVQLTCSFAIEDNKFYTTEELDACTVPEGSENPIAALKATYGAGAEVTDVLVLNKDGKDFSINGYVLSNKSDDGCSGWAPESNTPGIIIAIVGTIIIVIIVVIVVISAKKRSKKIPVSQ